MHRRLKHIIIAVICLSASAVLHAQNTKAQEEKRARLEKEIAIIDRQLADNKSKSDNSLADLTLIRKKVSNRKALVTESDRLIRKYKDDIYLTQLKINKMQARVDTLTEYYSRMVISAYKNRDARVWYMYILASDNISQAFRRMGYFRNLSSQMQDEARRIRQAQEDLEAEKERLAQMKKDAEDVKAARVKELDELKKDETKANAVVKKLNKDRKTYQAQLKAKRKEVEKLNKEIERIIAEAVKGKSQPAAPGKKKTEVDPALAAEFAKNKERLPWPADGPVVGTFGVHYHPVYKNLKLPPNNGIDIAVSKGESIKAVFSGVVQQVMVVPGYNQCVMVDHGNHYTLYCKLKSVSVKAGDSVKTGQTIGVIDTINGQTQLHFELWQGQKAQNPENWLQ